MAILDDVKTTLRITNTAYDTEITDLINACKADLALVGIVSAKIIDTDALIKQSIITYCKAYFGFDNKDADRFKMAYESIRNHLSLTYEYSFFAVTFTVTDSVTTNAIREANIRFYNELNNYEATYTTEENGQAIFYVRLGSNYKYDITADSYADDIHSDDDKNIIDISQNTAIAVSLTGV